MTPQLTLWLETATKNLAPAAKARVREQILEHYQAAFEHHAPKPEAEALALADLGSAELAGKKFERVHLTARELESLTAEKARQGRSTPVLLWLLGGLILIVAIRRGFYFDFSSLNILFVVFITALTTFGAQYLNLRRFVLMSLILNIFCLLGYPFIFVNFLWQEMSVFLIFFISALYVWWIWTTFRKLSSWRKLVVL